MAAALRRVRGVISATADRREAVVTRDPRTCSTQSLIDAVRRAGYSARVATTERCRIEVDMACDGCTRRVSSALFRAGGVKSLRLYDKRIARVTYDPERTTESKLVQAVRQAGFANARLVRASESGTAAASRHEAPVAHAVLR